MIVSIHQPSFLPWLGYFEKVIRSNCFVILDTVQFEKNSFDNRNKIKTKKGNLWLTIPVKTKGRFDSMTWQELEIQNAENWRKKHLKTIEMNYSKSPFFKKYKNRLFEIIDSQHNRLLDINIELLNFLFDSLEVQTKIIRASDLKIKSKKSDLVLDIVKKLDGNKYYSGALGKNYLELEKFSSNGIEVIFQDYKHPTYNQINGDFISHLSIIDLLFNEGKKSHSIIVGEHE